MDRTTTTDSLGIVTLASAAFKRGQLTKEEVHTISECADDFTQALSLANKYREMTGQSLKLDDIPAPTSLRKYMEAGDFRAAIQEATRIKVQMDALFQTAKQRLSELGLRIA